jgi:chorismate-pyruvate lyase
VPISLRPRIAAAFHVSARPEILARAVLSEFSLLQVGPRLANIATGSLLWRFLRHTGSTTAFLEDLLGEELRVEVLAHTEMGPGLERESLLKGSRTGPLVASHCLLNLAAWSDENAAMLRAGKTPIGRILKMQSASDLIKDRIAVENGGGHRLVALLSVPDADRAFHKRYRLMRGDTCLGEFMEAVSEASLRRAVSA